MAATGNCLRPEECFIASFLHSSPSSLPAAKRALSIVNTISDKLAFHVWRNDEDWMASQLKIHVNCFTETYVYNQFTLNPIKHEYNVPFVTGRPLLIYCLRCRCVVQSYIQGNYLMLEKTDTLQLELFHLTCDYIIFYYMDIESVWFYSKIMY